MYSVDINCDLGENFGSYILPNQDVLFDYISSANIACGFHAGDPDVMQYTVAKAIEKKVAIGAHPGFYDIQGFGRRAIYMTPKEVYNMVLYQIGALYGFVKAAGGRLHHVKPHGALYNMAARDKNLATAIAQAVFDFDQQLYLYGLAGSELIAAANKIGLPAASEVFADRTYQDNGGLTSRSQDNAVITDALQAIRQVSLMITQQQVASINQQLIRIKADTLCIHGDNAQALLLTKNIHNHLLKEGITIKAPSNEAD
ncbi:5-oxoprolinase subunit PxpA [Olivibacter sp. CPCC 100613]|uniref:LamB/YcsF family protein n=1 Tax=Olivibacter sp. CPCC 100613 TaxID=3079931 RepID=UPI002FF8122D